MSLDEEVHSKSFSGIMCTSLDFLRFLVLRSSSFSAVISRVTIEDSNQSQWP